MNKKFMSLLIGILLTSCSIVMPSISNNSNSINSQESSKSKWNVQTYEGELISFEYGNEVFGIFYNSIYMVFWDYPNERYNNYQVEDKIKITYLEGTGDKTEFDYAEDYLKGVSDENHIFQAIAGFITVDEINYLVIYIYIITIEHNIILD